MKTPTADRRQYIVEHVNSLYDKAEHTLRALLLNTYGSEKAALETIEFMIRRVRDQAEQHNAVAAFEVTFRDVET